MKSMTGYAKVQSALAGKKVNIEIKTLNSKQLDLIVKLPAAYRSRELEIRTLLGRLERGKVELTLSEENGTATAATFNRDLLSARFAALSEAAGPMASTPETRSLLFNTLAAMPDIESYLNDAREIFKRRRDLIVRRINEIEGMHIEPPKGAFYAFPEYDLKMKSADLAMELIKNGLVCTPGSAFGSYGEGHLRFSYAADEEKISKGMDILAKVYTKLRKEGQ